MAHPWLKPLGRRIKELRTAHALTQDKLAEAAGLSWNHICNVENARKVPSIDALYRISRVLHVEIRDLFDFRPNPAAYDAERLPGKLKQLAERQSPEKARMLYDIGIRLFQRR